MNFTRYEDLLRHVLLHGEEREDRTGVGTISVFGVGCSFDTADGFPLVTTKKVHYRSVLGELLWMLSGSTDVRSLRDEYGVTIWDEWEMADGTIGPGYGHQWRSWPDYDGGSIDQIRRVVDGIKSDPTSRRHVVTAWNPAQVDEMALPPCHMFFQFYVRQHMFLDCQVYMRSNDLFLGGPFNIASYATLMHMMAKQTEYTPGVLHMRLGDAHIYRNHVDQVVEQLRRDSLPLPMLHLDPVPSIFDYTPEDVHLVGYQHRGALSAPVAV